MQTIIETERLTICELIATYQQGIFLPYSDPIAQNTAEAFTLVLAALKVLWEQGTVLNLVIDHSAKPMQ